MCCLVMVLGLLGPRVAFLSTWIVTNRVDLAFSGGFWAPAVGFLFLPWTALFYVLAYAPLGGVSPLGWGVVFAGLILDLGTYSSRAAQQRYYSSPSPA